jgi:transcriptional regulator with XRE-family HTH domain
MDPKPALFEGAAFTGLRKAKGFKAYTLARRTGISVALLSQYETGLKAPSPEQLDRLLEPLGVSREEFADQVEELRRLAQERTTPPSFVELAAWEWRQIRAAGKALRRRGEAELEQWLRARHARAARRRAAVHVRRLLALPRCERPVVVAHDEQYHSWAVVEGLALASKGAAANDADHALELAQLAWRAAEKVEPSGPHRAIAMGFASAFVGNARRVKNDLDLAQEAFVRSLQLWREGMAVDPYPLEGWRILDLEASLRIDTQEFERALECLAAALAEAPQQSQGPLLLNKARVFEQKKEYLKALSALAEAEPKLDEKREPRNVWVLWFNRVVSLSRLGRFEEAEQILPEARMRAIALCQELDLTRTLWLEGRVAIGRGRLVGGIAALEQVAADFRTRDLALDGALVNLDLAMVELEQGMTVQVKSRALAAEWIFRAGNLHREAAAAFALFCEAARREVATVELARRVQAYLEEAGRNPALRFKIEGS